MVLPPGTSCWVITDGKIGDEVHCFGIAEALGLSPERRLVAPRAPWTWLAPYGPPPFRDRHTRPRSPIAPPFPDIAIGSGRRTVPYLRAVKRHSGGRTFTVFSKDPYRGQSTADVIYVPAHDRLRGDNIITTLTSPHRLTATAFAIARQQPDLRIRDLPGLRIGMVLGGHSGRITLRPRDATLLAEIARDLIAQGYSVMVTPSRRTPDFLLEAVAGALEAAQSDGRAFVWDRSGDNPYLAILALSDAIVITGDSVNMMGESAMSGAPIHVVEAPGGPPKMTWFIDRLIEAGAARRVMLRAAAKAKAGSSASSTSQSTRRRRSPRPSRIATAPSVIIINPRRQAIRAATERTRPRFWQRAIKLSAGLPRFVLHFR